MLVRGCGERVGEGWWWGEVVVRGLVRGGGEGWW
jgi:hypothetical protein